jgi:hypothetical protein
MHIGAAGENARRLPFPRRKDDGMKTAIAATALMLTTFSTQAVAVKRPGPE